MSDLFVRLFRYDPIKDPTAQQVKGFSIMPPNTLSDAQIQLVIGYIKSLK